MQSTWIIGDPADPNHLQPLTQPGEAPQAVGFMGYAAPCMLHVPWGAHPKVVTSGAHFVEIREREREAGRGPALWGLSTHVDES